MERRIFKAVDSHLVNGIAAFISWLCTTLINT